MTIYNNIHNILYIYIIYTHRTNLLLYENISDKLQPAAILPNTVRTIAV